MVNELYIVLASRIVANTVESGIAGIFEDLDDAERLKGLYCPLLDINQILPPNFWAKIIVIQGNVHVAPWQHRLWPGEPKVEE